MTSSIRVGTLALCLAVAACAPPGNTWKEIARAPIPGDAFRVTLEAPGTGETTATTTRTDYDNGFIIDRAEWPGATPTGKRILIVLEDLNQVAPFSKQGILMESLKFKDEALGDRAVVNGASFALMNDMGIITGQPFLLETSQCVGFHQMLRIYETTPADKLGDTYIVGYYCGLADETLDMDTMMRILLSVRYKGAVLD